MTHVEAKRLIVDAGLSMAQVARGVHLDECYFRNLMNGVHPISLEVQNKIGEVILMLTTPEPPAPSKDEPMPLAAHIDLSFKPEKRIINSKLIHVDPAYLREPQPETEKEMIEATTRLRLKRAYRANGRHHLIEMPCVIDSGDGHYKLLSGKDAVTVAEGRNIEAWVFTVPSAILPYLKS